MRRCRAALRKEWRQESRTPSGAMVTALFALVASIVLSVAIYGHRPDASLFAGLLWLILLFAGAVTLPRLFLSEDEAGTTVLLRLHTPPREAFFAKAILASVQMIVVAIVSGTVSLLTTGIHLAMPLLFWLALVLGAVSVGSTCTLCGAIASGARDRTTVAAAISVPLLVFLSSIGTTALLPTLGDPRGSAVLSIVGLAGYAVGTLMLGPPILAAVWKR